jgi:hypothetical protein
MAQVMMPREEVRVNKGRKGGAGIGQQVGAGIGGVVGGIYGGPGGAIQGASTGAGLGGMVGGMISPARQGSVIQPQQTQGMQMANGAVDRRIQEIQSNPHFSLQQAKAALSQMPTDIQKEYAPTIDMALEASRRAQKAGGIA